jgi:hypothetical protein
MAQVIRCKAHIEAIVGKVFFTHVIVPGVQNECSNPWKLASQDTAIDGVGKRAHT